MEYFTMTMLYKRIFFILPVLALFVLRPSQLTIAQQESATPTPTYDPLVEPPLPENPTEYELGRNLYWHWCMTCHGDRGQGLTDEFRSIWVSDHQDCWGRGCHAGHPGDQGFPIPTVVPALVSESHLERFTSVQTLAEYLKSTHPPQSPGVLKDDEYHAIAVFVFKMNERSLIDPPQTAAPAITFIPTASTAIPIKEPNLNMFPVYAMLTFLILIIGAFRLASSTHGQDR